MYYFFAKTGTPPVSHKNSIDDIGAVNKYLSLFDTGVISNGRDSAVTSAVAEGLYVSSCNLAKGLKKFPLDRHSCTIEFALKDFRRIGMMTFVNQDWPNC